MGVAKPTARLREKFQYNNIMYAAAGEAVARANQTTWEKLVEQQIFKPLGMTLTNTSLGQTQKSRDFSYGYAPPDAFGKNHAIPVTDLSAIGPAGAIFSNAHDLSQWLRLMLGGGVFNGKRLVSANGFKQLVSQQMHVSEHADYGLGWVLADWKGLRLVLHNGGFDGFHSLIEMVPDKNIGFALLANVELPTIDAAVRRIIWSNLLDIKTVDSSTAATNGASSAAGNLAELVGTYRATDGTSAALKLKDGKPTLTVPGDPPYTLIAKGVDEFRAVELPPSYSIRLKRDASGKVSSIVMVQPEGQIELKRYEQRAKTFISPIPIKRLMLRMVAAAGGEANLRKHRTVSASIALDFENQGVAGSGVVSARAPNSQSLEITLTALGETIGTTREYFDGRQGGEQSSFGGSEIWEGEELENKKIETDFYNQLLDWSTLFKSVNVVKMSKIGADRVFVIEKSAANGAVVRDYVSARTFYLLRRETGAGSDRSTESFSDFRVVDGVRLPFQTLQQSEQFGNVVIRIQKLNFNVDVPSNVFQALAK